MKKRALVVDDEVKLANLVTVFLEEMGFEVASAKEGADALIRMESWKPDLIILDVMMPGMDGYSFLREMKKRDEWRGIPVIALTGREMMRDLFIEEGVKEYFIKPFDPQAMEEAIRKLVAL